MERVEHSGVQLNDWLIKNKSSAQTIRSWAGSPVAVLLTPATLNVEDWIHELLHGYTGLNDVDLAMALGIKDASGMPWDNPSASSVISEIFRANCDIRKISGVVPN